MQNLWVMWQALLFLWGLPVLALGLLVGLLPPRYHLIALAVVISLFAVFIVVGISEEGSFSSDRFWSLVQIAFPSFLIALVLPLMLIKLCRARKRR